MTITKKCSIHGELDDHNSEWVDCWNCGGTGGFDGYEYDPLWYDEGDTIRCDICCGKGGWWVCGLCFTGEESED